MSRAREYHFVLKFDGPVWITHLIVIKKKYVVAVTPQLFTGSGFTRRGKGVLPCIMPAESLEAF